MQVSYQNRLSQRPSYVRTLTRVIHRRSRRSQSVTDRRRDTAWVNDEEFEVLETGIFVDDTLDSSWSRRAVNC